MEILEAFDLTGTLRGAAALVGCDHKTVAHWVRARDEVGGGLPLTDNERTVSVDHVCGIAVRNPQIVALPEPFALQLAGEAMAAAAAWRKLGCPFEAAVALTDADDETALLRALDELTELGAEGSAGGVRRRLRELGVSGVPRGPRPATRANPAQLTARQVEVLELLAAGLTNAEIAAELVISPKTAGHHVSAILDKLGARSRLAAANAARELGLAG